MSAGAVALVALGGGLGAALRLVVDGWVGERWRAPFPLATATINVLGSLVIGLLAGLALRGGTPAWWWLAGAVGLCGGFTTFSTATVEVVRLARSGHPRAALGQVAVTALVAPAAAWLGLVATAP